MARGSERARAGGDGHRAGHHAADAEHRPVGARDARAGHGWFLDGMGQITLDTGVGAGGTIEPTQDPVTGLPDPRAKTPTRLRSISSVTLQRPFRQERIEADYAGAAAGNGGAIISTRDAVSLGFGLEQVTDAAVRGELVRRMMAYLLPIGGGHRGADGHLAAAR